MSEIHVKDNESLDSALKRFKRSCAKAGVLSDLRKKEYYQSPSVKRRKKSEAARKNKRRYYWFSQHKKAERMSFRAFLFFISRGPACGFAGCSHGSNGKALRCAEGF